MTSPAVFAAKCRRMTTVVPRAQRQANEQAARAIKPLWFAQAGLSSGSTIAGRKVSIRDDTAGTAHVTTLIRWQGPVHLVEGPTAKHFIGARHLGTRGSLRAKSRRVGATAAFGGSNRGAFGSFLSTTTRRGVTRTRRGKKALTIGGNLRAYAFHPGTKGRRFWAKNKATARTVATTVYKQAALPSMLREAGF